MVSKNDVLRLFRQLHLIEAERKKIQAVCVLMEKNPDEIGNANRLKDLECLAGIIEIWRLMLAEEDRFIVDRHII